MKSFEELYNSHYSSHNVKLIDYNGFGEFVTPRKLSQWGTTVEECLSLLSQENTDTLNIVTRLAEVVDERDKAIESLITTNNKLSDRVDSLVSVIKYLDNRVQQLENKDGGIK